MRAFLTSSENIEVLKNNGCVGALINTLLKVNIKEEAKSRHVENTVQSLHILLNDDTIAQQRFITNPNSIPLIIKLCKHTTSDIQSMCFDIIEWISLIKEGMDKLITNDIMILLFLPQLLHSSTSLTRVKHGAVQMILKITLFNPNHFIPYQFEEVLLDKEGIRILDSYMEIQLLNAMLAHLKFIASEKKSYTGQFLLIPYFIQKIVNETFDDLVNLNQIIQCIYLISQYKYQIIYLLQNDLLIALHYIVRTDFELYRRKQTKDSAELASSLKKQRDSKSLLADHRPLPTLMALSLVKPQAIVSNKSDDINFNLTVAALNIYENILDTKPDVVSAIVPSGLIPALIFRVGNGPSLDIRMNKYFVKFIHKVLLKVCFAQPRYGRRISLVSSLPKPIVYTRGNLKDDDLNKIYSNEEIALLQVSIPTSSGIDRSNYDLKMISNTMRAQGVTNLLIQSIKRTEENDLVKTSLLCLSYFEFSAIKDDIYLGETISRICHLTRTRQDCYFSGLALVCDAILYPDVSDNSLNEFIECNAIEMLIRALNLSSWFFTMKETVYKTLAKLSTHPKFYERLLKCSGTRILCFEIRIRKNSNDRKNRRERAKNDEEDDGTDALLYLLKKDYAATMIQSIARKRTAQKRSMKIRKASIMNLSHMPNNKMK